MYAFSNAIAPGQENNSLSKFTNALSSPISFSDRTKWKIGIRSVSMSNSIISEYDTDFLQIKCDQLSGENDSKQIISLHSKRVSANYLTTHTWTPRIIEWFSPNSDVIESLTFTLLDNHNRQLQLAPGRPTIILLEFRKMSGSGKEFVVRVSSRPTDQYPGNKPHHFVASLPLQHSYFAQSPFEVAVSSITYTPQFQAMYYHQAPKLDFELYKNDLMVDTYSVPLTEVLNCSCEEELMDILNQHFHQFHKSYGKEHDYPAIKGLIDSTTNTATFFSLSESYNPFSGLLTGVEVHVKVPYNLAMILGAANPDAEWDESVPIIVKKDKVTRGDLPINLDILIPRSLVIYTDFTEPVLAGSGKSSIVKIFPITEEMIEKPSHLTQESESLEFYRIDRASLTDLEFSIRQVSGDIVHFKMDQPNEIILTLIVREKI